jgi:UDP-N-acetyl-D-glucosamine/UDP-N-acetyl-D-galactosamine dehydrogenase
MDFPTELRGILRPFRFLCLFLPTNPGSQAGFPMTTPRTLQNTVISVTGLGYVGLPIALAFAQKFHVIGFDIHQGRIEKLKQGIDPSGEVEPDVFEGARIEFSANAAFLKKANFHIVAVPTPIDVHTMPDLGPLLSATETIGKALKPGDYVVFESTTYPACTEEDCVPLLEEISGLKMGKDFKVGFSPERINPGDKEHTLRNVIKVVSGNDDEALQFISEVYGSIVEAGIYRASSIKVAEAAKIIENTQRDLNIALMNEISMICDRLKINTFEVLEAAGTKWNFLRFTPGLVGGHCIGVDPYYLTYKSKALGHDPKIILAGRYTNDQMPGYIAKKTVQKMVKQGKSPAESRVLVLGVTFKEGVSDVRNSKVAELVQELKAYSLQVDVVDPFADAEALRDDYQIDLAAQPNGNYDALVLAVAHKPFLAFENALLQQWARFPALMVDIKGLYRKKSEGFEYWSL